MDDDRLNATYLRFSEAELLGHFAEVATGGVPDRHLTYFRTSVTNADLPAPTGPSKAIAAHARLARQMQKDERFWIVDTLLTLFHRSGDRTRAFAQLLEAALPQTPVPAGYASWAKALGDPEKLRVYFEVNLPATPAYQDWLAKNLTDRTLVPWIRDAAVAAGKKRLEGATKVDALLISAQTGVAVVFEAKVLSDISVQVGYDAARNQLARIVDVMLESNPKLRAPLNQRDPSQTYFVLVTPALFQSDPTTRLYGWLMQRYMHDDELLTRHLPHRGSLPADLHRRLGWSSSEQLRTQFGDCCPWLTT